MDPVESYLSLMVTLQNLVARMSFHVGVHVGSQHFGTYPEIAGPSTTIKTCLFSKLLCQIRSFKVKRCGRWER